MLVHGGLYEPMDAAAFWVRPGIMDGLSQRGLTVIAPNRIEGPTSWAEEAAHLVALNTLEGPAHVVAGSNGCSAAVRLAIDHPDVVASLVLCWPATNGSEQNRLTRHVNDSRK